MHFDCMLMVKKVDLNCSKDAILQQNYFRRVLHCKRHKQKMSRQFLASSVMITLVLLAVIITHNVSFVKAGRKVDSREFPFCHELHPSQYKCQMPNISTETFEYENCPIEGKLNITCSPVNGVNCTTVDDGEMLLFDDENRVLFLKTIDCYYTNGFKFFVAVALSVFLGICGIDR